MKKITTFGIVMIFVFVACIPAVTSQFEMENRECPILDTITINEESSDDCTQCLDVYSWPLLDNTARVTAYSGNGYGGLSHRIIRGLGVKGGEYDEIDSIRNMERIEVTFNSPQYLTFFEVRSFFARGFIDPITEEGDVDLYLGGDLVKHYDIVGVYPYGIIGKVRVTVSPTILMDKIVFYVDEDEDYSSYSEFTVAKIGIANDDISFVLPFSGIDVVKRCLFQLDMNVLDGEADDSFDVFVDDMFVYGYIDDPPVNDSEAWHMHSIDLFPFIIHSSGVHTVRINATGEQWCGQPTYGQVAVDTIELYNVNVTMHQGIRRLAYRRVDVDTLPLCCDPPVLCDSVDIGKPISEAGHNLQEWGLIEPDTHGGHYGGIDDCRVTWQSAESFRWATVDLSCDVEKHNLVINVVGSGTTDPSPGTYSYTDGTIVELEAIHDLGWSFDRWDGDVADPNSIITNITMNDDEDVTAYFTEKRYTLNITVDGNGTVTKNPDKPYYFYNEFVNLTAVADIGWSFANWSGDLNGTKNPTTICMNDSKEVTATFIEDWYTITITINGSGTVAATPIGPYRYNDVVTLSPAPLIGWLFGSWSGSDADAIVDNKIIMTKDMEVTATFIEEWYTLNVTIVGNGTVDVDPIGPYRYDTDVKLTAVPEYGWSFNSWSGDLNDSNNPEIIVMNNNKDVTAHFTGECYTLNITVDGDGAVIKNPDKTYYVYGESVELTAVPAPGWYFDSWNGPDAGEIVGNHIIMTKDMFITARFSESPIMLYVEIIGNGHVDVDPAGPYTYGTVVTLTPEPAVGWSFDGWSGPDAGDLVPVLSSWTITMDENKEVTATFTEDQYILNITINGNGTVTKDPSQDTYTYGTSVNLTAIADTYWEFKKWSGDLNSSENPETIVINANTMVIATFIQQGWIATMTIEGDIESPALLHMEDYVHFGERVNASDGVDEGVDIPYPGEPPAPYIASWFKTDFEEPYNRLEKDIRHYPGVRPIAKIWDLWVKADTAGNGATVDITISWDTNDLVDIQYDYVGLYDALSGNFLKDMNVANTYAFTLADGMAYHFQIICGWNYQIDVERGWNLISIPAYEENFDKTDLIIQYPCVGGNYYTWNESTTNDNPTGKPIILKFVYGWEADGYVNYNDLTRGDGYWLWAYMDCRIVVPSVAAPEDHIRTFDDGEGWYLVGIPYTADLTKEQVQIQYNAVYYNWSEAVDAGIILPYLYGWNRTIQNYEISECFMSGYGYWMYVYHSCMLKKA